MKPVLIIGCGDIGERVARLCQQNGAEITGLVRSIESADRLQEKKIRPIQAALDQSDTLQGLPIKGADIYYFAPPPTQGNTDPHMHYFIAAIKPDELPAKIILISTTAVYGDCQGAWITEEQPVNPQTDRGKRRLDSENSLQQWAQLTGVPIVILRVGGIYGPGRLPIARLQKGLPILREEESPFTNRIHQDDLAQICVASAKSVKAGEYSEEIYNVSDGQPSTMSRYFKEVAKACGLPQPPEVTKAEAEKVMTEGMLSYLQESRRLDNKKLLQGLHITLLYPNLDEGLKQCDVR